MSTTCQPFCWITAQADRVEHAVTDDAQANGMATGMGRFAPVCGRRFLAACMDTGPAGRCSCCAWLVQVRADLRAFHEHLTAYRQRGWLDRMLCRYEDPTDPATVGGSDATPRVHIELASAHPQRARHAA